MTPSPRALSSCPRSRSRVLAWLVVTCIALGPAVALAEEGPVGGGFGAPPTSTETPAATTTGGADAAAAPADAAPAEGAAASSGEDQSRPAEAGAKRRRSAKRRVLPPPRVDLDELGPQADTSRWGQGRGWQVGVRGGFVAVPAGLLHVFVDGGATKIGGAVGAYVVYQRNLLEISGNVWWADYSYDHEVIFQTAGDRNDPEFVSNGLSLITINVDFVWAHWFTRWMAATFGFGLGLSAVLGDVTRNEATPPTGPYTSTGEEPTDGYVHCRFDPADPSWSTPFCESPCTAESLAAGTCPPRASSEESGDLLGYYNDPEDRIPAVLPWINFLVGLRLLPHEHFQIDIQSGFGLGFVFLARMGYRF
jgi:hypothetical protein